MVKSVLETFPLPAGLTVTFKFAAGVTVPVTGKVNVGFAGSFVVIVIVAVKVPATPAGGLKLTSSSPPLPGET
jgi:hypothetical protein